VTDQPLLALRAPFTAEQTGHLPKVTCPDCADRNKTCAEHKRRTCPTCKAYVSTRHIHIDFVGHAHVTERLLDVDPNWYWEPLAFNGNGLPALDDNNGLWIKLSVGGMTRIGYGHAGSKRGGDAVKETIGDAIRNAAMRFGVALDLWKKEAPAPIADVPDRQVERPAQTEDERKRELRGQIAAKGRAKGRDINQIADDFLEWSRGTEIGQASIVILAEYLDHLQREAE
jgi:hypothetical protein